jgi:hypothetical protein
VNVLVPSKEELSFAYGPPETVPRYTLYPITVTVDVPSVQLRVAEWVGWTPVAETVIDAGEFEASLTTETLPVTVPVAAGAKVTFKVAVRLGGMVSPAYIPPPTVSPGPESVTLEMWTLPELPELVNVTLRVELLPIFTLPKLRDEALAVKGPGSTVSVAALLVTDPAELLTTTLNWVPLAKVVSIGVV